MGCKILQGVTWPWPRPFQGRFFIGRLGLAVVISVPNLKSLGSSVTKLWNITDYLDTQNDSGLLARTHTHTRLMALCPGLPGWAGTRKVKPIWILLKQETVSGSGISWVICKSAPCSRQITTPATDHSVFYRPDALPAAQPTASKHWRHKTRAS